APHEGPPAPIPGREEEAQEVPGVEPQLPEVPGKLQSQHVFSHTQMVVLRWLFHCPLPPHRRKSKAYRRMLLQMKTMLKSQRINMSGKLSQ
ncbi:unnamed protein product, partial [Gulo gulo]